MEYPSIGTPPAGSIRFNTDSSKMEIYNGEKWWEIDSTSPEAQTGGTRGVFAGGEAPNAVDVIQYVNVDTTGNAVDFGNLVATGSNAESVASRTRGIVAGAAPGGNVIQYITISSTGNAADFGDLSSDRNQAAGASDSTRGLILGGYIPSPGSDTNNIQYITMASTGDSVDFGDLTAENNGNAAASSPTRALSYAGGQDGSPYINNMIDYVTIAHTGNAADFGDPVGGSKYMSSASNAVRAVFAGGRTAIPGQTDTNRIDYVIIATLGSAVDFGDLVQSIAGGNGGAASATRGVFGGGYYWAQPSGTHTKADNIQYVQFASTGNALDFGNLLAGNQYPTGFSNGHGGLG